MDDEMTVSIVVSVCLICLMAAVITAEIVWLKKMRRKYIYNFRSHEIVFEVARSSVRLYIDGKLEDEIGGVRVCILHAAVEGIPIKARYELRGFKPRIDVTADATPLQLLAVNK